MGPRFDQRGNIASLAHSWFLALAIFLSHLDDSRLFHVKHWVSFSPVVSFGNYPAQDRATRPLLVHFR